MERSNILKKWKWGHSIPQGDRGDQEVQLQCMIHQDAPLQLQLLAKEYPVKQNKV